MLIALITVPYLGRFRLVLLPDRASYPPPTRGIVETTGEAAEAATGPGLTKTKPVLQLVRRAS